MRITFTISEKAISAVALLVTIGVGAKIWKKITADKPKIMPNPTKIG